MIQLPENFLDQAYIDSLKGVILLFFKNSADQYFFYRYNMDKAFTFDENVERLRTKDFSNTQAYVINDDLGMILVAPNTQDWRPVPYMGDNIMSFKQYQAHAAIARGEKREGKTEPDANS